MDFDLTNKVVSASVAPRIEHGRFAVGITDIRGIGEEGAIVAGSWTKPKVYGRRETVTAEYAITPVINVGYPSAFILTVEYGIIVLSRTTSA